ncbi:mechanosensitive ion channel family protein [Vibrio sonorensis]|uniref:mechanosensitive ion channel family protein n=1 Tax=Vibrio sonorensis TaxID=1004316 RepID=UPI0008DA8B0F|nr:mechanosensitive ion channel domain-containing protein [Vibrio sonorensis]
MRKNFIKVLITLLICASSSGANSSVIKKTYPNNRTPKLFILELSSILDEIQKNIYFVKEYPSNKKTHLKEIEHLRSVFSYFYESKTNNNGVNLEIILQLIEIFNRLPKNLHSNLKVEKTALSFLIPGSPIKVTRIDGRYYFSGLSNEQIKNFYSVIKKLPSRGKYNLYHEYIISAGEIDPPGWFNYIEGLPKFFFQEYLEQAVWQWLIYIFIIYIAIVCSFFLFVLLKNKILLSFIFIVEYKAFIYLMVDQINISGKVLEINMFFLDLFILLNLVFLSYNVVERAPYLLLRLNKVIFLGEISHIYVRTCSIFVSIVVLIYGLSILNAPMYGIVSGFGIGGLILAFSIKSTIENIISGVIITLEGNYKKGDYIKIGRIKGKVVLIGFRSTTLENDNNNKLIIPNSLLLSKETIIDKY